MLNIALTERAVQKMIEIIHKQPNPEQIQGVQISVVGGGCKGFQYEMRFAPLKARFFPEETLVFGSTKPNGNPHKLKVFINVASMLFLDGTTIDYTEALEGSGFKFDNPNAQEKCACGQSFKT